MSNKNKKLYPSKYKAKNRSYQNFWHISKLTKKQQKWSKFKGKMHSTEQGRPVAKHRLYKTVRPSFTTSKIRNNHGERQKVQYPYTRTFAAEIKSGVSSKKAHGLYSKNFWFFDKAAPIPGVSFLKKAKVLYSLKQCAYKKFQSMLAIQNKKQIVNLFNIVKKKNLSKNWNAIMQMDSLYNSVQRKTAFAYNARERKAAYHSNEYTINGKYYTNKIGVVKAADLFTANTNNSILGNRTAKIAQPSRQMSCVGLRSLRSVVPKTSPFQTVLKSLQKKNKKSSPQVYLYRKQYTRVAKRKKNTKSLFFGERSHCNNVSGKSQKFAITGQISRITAIFALAKLCPAKEEPLSIKLTNFFISYQSFIQFFIYCIGVGCRQVGRHQVLALAFRGSNPLSPVLMNFLQNKPRAVYGPARLVTAYGSINPLFD